MAASRGRYEPMSLGRWRLVEASIIPETSQKRFDYPSDTSQLFSRLHTSQRRLQHRNGTSLGPHCKWQIRGFAQRDSKIFMHFFLGITISRIAAVQHIPIYIPQQDSLLHYSRYKSRTLPSYIGLSHHTPDLQQDVPQRRPDHSEEVQDDDAARGARAGRRSAASSTGLALPQDQSHCRNWRALRSVAR